MDKRGNSTNSSEWMNNRIHLFKTFCVPSIVGQTNQNFLWLCLFDKDTQSKYIHEIDDMLKSMNNYVPIFLSSEESSAFPLLLKEVITCLKDDSPYLITTRVDNDDALNKSFIQTILDILDCQKESDVFYSFTCGLQYYTEANIAVQLSYPRNHFPALICKNSNKKKLIHHIMEYNHFYLQQCDFPFVQIKNLVPMWIETIHERNVDNDIVFTFRQHIVYRNNILKNYFSLAIELNYRNTLNKFFTFLLPRIFSQFLKRGVRRILYGKKSF